MPELILTNDHRYLLDGKPIDGLTSTIKEANLGWKCDPWYGERGSALHSASEYHDKDTLDESTVDPQIQGYLESWRQFRKDQNYKPTHIEYLTYHPTLLVGCKIDRLPGPVDLKAGVVEGWHILQIAFQWTCLKEHNIQNYNQKPMDVYLDPDGGPPKVKVYSPSELREAFKVYASMLHFIRWKREKGVKNGNTSRSRNPRSSAEHPESPNRSRSG